MHPLAERLVLALAPRAGYAYLRLCRATMTIDYRGREVLDRLRAASPGHYILAFWHSRFAMMPYVYPGGRITVLSSMHRDSEILARILLRFGLDLSKGSTTRGGVAGMRDILRKVRAGFDVGFTPDGPKGPRRRVKMGVVTTARLTGLPIVPVAFSARPARRLRSWDGTLVPRPFGRGLFLYGEPIVVPREASGVEEERWRALVEEALDRITDEADRVTGLPLEAPKAPPAGSA
jgi:lysophospholipid acyltransferase (LPLAT)-like uncharacterized protein